MGAPDQPEPQVPQGTMIAPWGVDFPVIGNGPGGKIAAIVINRQMGEKIVCAAYIDEIEALLQTGLDLIRQHKSGIVVPPAGIDLSRLIPPPNGHRG